MAILLNLVVKYRYRPLGTTITITTSTSEFLRQISQSGNPLFPIALYIYYDQYEEIWRKHQTIFFVRFVSMEVASLLNITFLIIFVCKKHKSTFQFFGGKNIHNVLRSFFLYVFIILFNNDSHTANLIQFCQNMVPKHGLAKNT